MALPNRANACVMPCANPRWSGGVHALHRARRHRKRRAFADAQHHAHEKQRHEPAGQAGENRRRRPDQAAGEQRPPRTEAIADPSAEDLKEDVRVSERRRDVSPLRRRQVQFLPDLAGRRRDIRAIDVRDEIHQAQEPKDHLGGGGFAEAHARRAYHRRRPWNRGIVRSRYLPGRSPVKLRLKTGQKNARVGVRRIFTRRPLRGRSEPRRF